MRDRQLGRKARRRGAPGTGMSTAVGLTVLIAALLILVARSQPHGQASPAPSETRVISVPTMPPPAPATATSAPAPTVAPTIPPVPTDTALPPPTDTAEAVLTGTASIESIAVHPLSAAGQVEVVVKGYLPDACTTVDQISQARTDTTLQITITTARPLDKACVQTVVPFERTVPLDVAGLPPGTYTVHVNSAHAIFTLPAATPRP